MKLHWGTGIVVAFLAFAAGILVMVYIAMNQRVDLVSDDYYQLELRHQEQIESVKRTSQLSVQPRIGVSDSLVVVTMPLDFSPTSTTGTLMFYRPADRRRDFVVPLKLHADNTQTINTRLLQKGLWRLKVRWINRNQAFYHEEPIIIQ